MAEKRYTLPKRERLKSAQEIKELFSKGSSFFLYPYKVKVVGSVEPTLPQILISVPKRVFKKAVTRNRIRRQIREAYRLAKGQRLGEIPFKAIAIIFVGKEPKVDSDYLQKRMGKLLDLLCNEGDKGSKKTN